MESPGKLPEAERMILARRFETILSALAAVPLNLAVARPAFPQVSGEGMFPGRGFQQGSGPAERASQVFPYQFHGSAVAE